MVEERDTLRQDGGASLTDVRYAAYRESTYKAVLPDAWREVVRAAVGAALAGDRSARECVQRLLGIANAAKTEMALEELEARISHSELLTMVEDRRNGRARIERTGVVEREETRVFEERALGEDVGAMARVYWRIVFELITPKVWGKIVEVARLDAQIGDGSARDWIVRLLGADDALAAQERVDERDSIVTLSTLLREIRITEARKSAALAAHLASAPTDEAGWQALLAADGCQSKGDTPPAS